MYPRGILANKESRQKIQVQHRLAACLWRRDDAKRTENNAVGLEFPHLPGAMAAFAEENGDCEYAAIRRHGAAALLDDHSGR